MGDGNIPFHWLLSVISAILIASHCNSPENRDGRGCSMEYIFTFFNSIAASVVAYYICKWLDGNR